MQTDEQTEENSSGEQNSDYSTCLSSSVSIVSEITLIKQIIGYIAPKCVLS